MENKPNTISRFITIMRYAARFLVILWALWWIAFGIITIASEDASASDIFIGIVIIILFGFIAVCPWLWERLGSYLLFIIGFIILIGYPFVARSLPIITILSMEVTLALPPMVTGVLFFFLSKLHKTTSFY